MNPAKEQWVFAIEENKLQENSASPSFSKRATRSLIKSRTGLNIENAHMACGLLDFTIQCPCHDWKYDIRTGSFWMPKKLKSRSIHPGRWTGRFY
jgi:3-phenylpropionate/trans-cinnamate dioxygenase ferredoxin subunit